MNWLLSVLVAVSCAMAVVAQAPDENSTAARRARLKAALQEEWEYRLRTYPELATAVGDNRYNDRLSDYSPEFFAGEVQHARQALQIFESIDTAGFPEQERLSKDLMIRDLREQIEGARFKDWEMPVDQMNGVHLALASLPSDTTFRSGERLSGLHCPLASNPPRSSAGHREHAGRPARASGSTPLPAGEGCPPGAGHRGEVCGRQPVHPARATLSRRHFRSRAKDFARGGVCRRQAGGDAGLRAAGGILAQSSTRRRAAPNMASGRCPTATPAIAST